MTGDSPLRAERLIVKDPAFVTLWPPEAGLSRCEDRYVAWRSWGRRKVLRVGRDERHGLALHPTQLRRFDWGSRSPGAVLLASALLDDATDVPSMAHELAPALVAACLASAPPTGFVLRVDDVRRWAARQVFGQGRLEPAEARGCLLRP